MPNDTTPIEIITNRRRYNAEQKLMLIEEIMQPDIAVDRNSCLNRNFSLSYGSTDELPL